MVMGLAVAQLVADSSLGEQEQEMIRAALERPLATALLMGHC